MEESSGTKTEPAEKRLLIIDDEENMRHMMTQLLGKSGYLVDEAANGQEGLERVNQARYDFILCDLKMPKMDGMAFLRSIGDRMGTTAVIMMSAYGTIDTAIDAMKLGAYDYISKPFKSDEVLLVLRKAEEREILRQENRWLREQIRRIENSYSFGKMIAKSEAMQSVFKLADRAARYNTTVLISGESGTGKELIAKGIHFGGPRSEMPFIAVNCGGIPENLLESELFGYKKGAFTGADRDRKGLFAEANGGTVFLDEIGELPLALQVKLLRVLQEGEMRPVGDARSRSIDVRFVAATAKELDEEVRKGAFREDLFYRLNVLPIKLPPLRDRPEDIPPLCDHFIGRFSERLGIAVDGIAPAAMSVLLKHGWPGNVRELENAIERAMVLAEERVLLPDNLPPGLGVEEGAGEEAEPYDGHSLKVAQRILEKTMITKALKATGGNRTRAARLLEISHPSLLSKVKAYDIPL